MAFSRYLTGFCTIAAKATSVDPTGYTKTVYNTGTVHNCRVDVIPMSRESEVNARVANTRRFMLFLEPDAVLDSASRVTSEGINYNVITSFQFRGRRGKVHHQEITLERVE